MSNLLLPSIHIQNFRAFRELRIEKLGRINLIVGKNSVGKTSFLEALWLYSNQGDISIIESILSSRDELENPIRKSGRETSITPPLSYLFFERQIPSPQKPILIGSNKTSHDLLVLSINDNNHSNNNTSSLSPAFPKFTVQSGSETINTYYVYFDPASINDYPSSETRFPNIFIDSRGLKIGNISHFWDNITLTDLENEIVSALQIINPNIERVSLIGGSQKNTYRHPIVKIRALETPIPLKSLGDGMLRAFGIALALVNVRDGILLVDEFESGLHYSVQLDLWRLIFQTARRLNIQVFATTHSWDCVEAFQKAAEEDQGEDAVLIRLERNNGDIKAVIFDEEMLHIATRDQIEVR